MAFINLEKLSNEELEIGITKSLENAEDLIAEGDILSKEKRFSRAYTLYQLASEETGKSRLLFSLILNRELGSEIDFKTVNGEFTHHQTKSKSAIVFEAILLLALHSSKDDSVEERKNKFLEAVQELHQESEDIDILNNRKNNSLYVGVVDNKFVSPNDSITQGMVTALRTNVLIRLHAGKTVLKGMLTDLDKIIKAFKEIDNVNDYEINDKFFDSFFKD